MLPDSDLELLYYVVSKLCNLETNFYRRRNKFFSKYVALIEQTPLPHTALVSLKDSGDFQFHQHAADIRGLRLKLQKRLRSRRSAPKDEVSV